MLSIQNVFNLISIETCSVIKIVLFFFLSSGKYLIFLSGKNLQKILHKHINFTQSFNAILH